MGILDFIVDRIIDIEELLGKKEVPVESVPEKHSTNISKNAELSSATKEEEDKSLHTNQEPLITTDVSDISEINESDSTSVLQKKQVSVTDRDVILESIILQSKPEKVQLKLYCPIKRATIFCHSILVDKLGDLTKFIVKSLYRGYSLDDINVITGMGDITIKEELEYLIRGELVNEDDFSLTELGMQYGKLLVIFEELSGGISFAYNAFTNLFEPLDEVAFVDHVNEKYVLDSHFIPTLARNDNFANSLMLAREHVLSDTPFCDAIKNSLYTTVKIERETKYKSVYIRDFERGSTSRSDSCVRIAIPFDRVAYRTRYKGVDPYRKDLLQIKTIDENYPELISKKGKELLEKISEEDCTSEVILDINTVTGGFSKFTYDLTELPDDKSVYVLERQEIQVALSTDLSEDLYLEELSREHLYWVRYYPYVWMESDDHEERSSI